MKCSGQTEYVFKYLLMALFGIQKFSTKCGSFDTSIVHHKKMKNIKRAYHSEMGIAIPFFTYFFIGNKKCHTQIEEVFTNVEEVGLKTLNVFLAYLLCFPHSLHNC